MTASSLPTGHTLFPYGRMNETHQWDMQRQPVPDAFMWHGRKATPAQFTAYIDSEAREIADNLWPRYDGGWQGHAAPHAVQLTVDDLELMDELREHLFEQAPCGTSDQRFTHRALFEKEDLSAKPTLELYFPRLQPELLDKLRQAVVDAFPMLGPVHLRFKAHLQRPRACQTAFWLGRQSFVHEHAASADTPAMISGHCLQGLVVRTLAFFAQRRLVQNHPGGEAAMRQYCVDIGDRRVFAGVHYPSDNVGSWYCALRLCDHLFGTIGPQAKVFMWKAITEHSTVYKALQRSAATRTRHAAALAFLQAEADRDVVVHDGSTVVTEPQVKLVA